MKAFLILILGASITTAADQWADDSEDDSFWLGQEIYAAQRRQWQHEDNEAYWAWINRQIWEQNRQRNGWLYGPNLPRR